MKSKASIFWFVVAFALGAALVVQWNGAKKQQVKLEQLQLQVEQGAAAKDPLKTRVKELEKDRTKLIGELRATEFELNNTRMAYNAAAQMTNNPQATQLSGAARGAGQQGNEGPGGMGKMLANMMKDPEMRKVMAQQQGMAVDMMYGSLMKQLDLTPEQQKKFKEILLTQQMASMEQAGAMFEGDGADRAKVAQELAEKHKQNQEEIKELLGDEKYAQYEDYNQTMGERMMLEQFGKQADISPAQNEQLLAIMREEKNNVQINRGVQPMDPTQDWQKMLESGAAEQLFSQQEEVNQRVLERAGQVLTPEQLQQLAPILKGQLEMQKMGMKMAQQMFGGNNDNVPQLEPPQPAPER